MLGGGGARLPSTCQRIFIQEENSKGFNFYGKSRNLSNPVVIQGRVDRMLADLCSWKSDDVGYPNMHKNWNFRFFGQISSPSRPFSWIFCQNLDFQKFDLYPYNFELSCSHQFLTDNGQFYHFSKGKSVLRCEIWNFGSTIILRYKFC